ncbi:MAG: cupin domain-containing protein [Gammaproteobacteria bacterium]|nr:cupin domain-containing protein [Gammaproteobacteria bacterium]
MKMPVKSILYCAVFLLMATAPVRAGAEDTSPIRLPEDKLAGINLGEFAPWPDEMILAGASEHTFSELFNGEIVIGMYQARPIKLDISSPWPFDELVMVLQGELHLTESGSDETGVYPAGSMLVVPRGFTGTWEMVGDYRELFVVEKQAYIASQQPGGLFGQ